MKISAPKLMLESLRERRALAIEFAGNQRAGIIYAQEAHVPQGQLQPRILTVEDQIQPLRERIHGGQT